MFNRFYSLSSIHSPKFAAICFALVLLLLAQPVAACDLHYKIHVQCENGHQERLYSLEELSEFSLPEECEATPQIVQDFTMALATIVPRVAETQTQWVNLNIMIGDNVVVPVYGLDDCILRETKKVGDVVVIYDQAHSYCVFKSEFCHEYWSISYIRKTLADAEAGNIGNFIMSIFVALTGMVFGAKVGEKDYRLGRFFPKKLAYGLFGFLGLYALVKGVAYYIYWVGVLENLFLAPLLVLVFVTLKLFQFGSFGEFFLMIAVSMFVLVFVAMQIRLWLKRKRTQKSV